MDPIAIISDIHGNLLALEAVLDDIAARGIETIYCLGDLVGKGSHSAEAVDVCRERCDLIIQGNWDDFIGRPTDNPEFIWHQEQLGPERLAYLANLPPTIDFQMSGKQIRLFHASQESVYVRVYPNHPAETLLAMFTNTDFTSYNHPEPDVVGYGDIHGAYLLPVYPVNKTLFNVGSVGNALDQTLATYVVLEGQLMQPVEAPLSIQIIRVPYDIELAIEQARQRGMPGLEAYAMELREAKYRGRHAKVKDA